MSLLGKRWAMDHADGKNNHEDSIIITATNKEAYTLSEMIRQTRSQWGDVSNDETMGRSLGVIVPVLHTTTARSIAFDNSLTLPGHA